MVATDVEKGFVTPAAAEQLYGVVLAGGQVDEEATERLRVGRRRERVPLFDFGPRPEQYVTTLELPEIEPLGPEQAAEPRSIDVGLLDSRE